MVSSRRARSCADGLHGGPVEVLGPVPAVVVEGAQARRAGGAGVVQGRQRRLGGGQPRAQLGLLVADGVDQGAEAVLDWRPARRPAAVPAGDVADSGSGQGQSWSWRSRQAAAAVRSAPTARAWSRAARASAWAVRADVDLPSRAVDDAGGAGLQLVGRLLAAASRVPDSSARDAFRLLESWASTGSISAMARWRSSRE